METATANGENGGGGNGENGGGTVVTATATETAIWRREWGRPRRRHWRESAAGDGDGTGRSRRYWRHGSGDGEWRRSGWDTAGTEGSGQQRSGLVGTLETPSPGSFQSGIGVICGWVCEAEEVVIDINGQPWQAAYGTARADTKARCGDINNGLGLLFNWNLLGDGVHTLVIRADGVEFGRAGDGPTRAEEFVRGLMGETVDLDFPNEGTDAAAGVGAKLAELHAGAS